MPARPRRPDGLAALLLPRLAALALTLFAALSAGCTTLAEPVVSAPAGTPARFEGLTGLAVTPEPTAVDILLVHGMCSHDASWANSAIAEVATMLGATSPPAIQRLPVAHSAAEVFGADLSTPQWSVRVAAILWSPLLAPTKARLSEEISRESDSAERPTPRQPARFTPLAAAPWSQGPAYSDAATSKFVPVSALRSQLIDDCLADAVIYLGRARDQINDEMQQSLLTAARHFEARRGAETAVARPLVLITQNLGSKLAFDALLRMRQDYSLSHVGDHLAERARQSYLVADQLPFLALGDATLDVDSGGLRGPAERRRLARLVAAAGADGGTGGRVGTNTTATRGKPAVASPRPRAPRAGAATSAPGQSIVGMPDPWYEQDPVAAFLRTRASEQANGRGPTVPPPQVVAINDPYDLMAYRRPASQPEQRPLIEVSLELEPVNPGIVRPLDPVHLNYLRDARVRSLILCGYGLPTCQASSPINRRD